MTRYRHECYNHQKKYRYHSVGGNENFFIIIEVKRSPSGVDSLPSASLSQDSPLGDVAEVPEEAEAVVEADEAEEDKEPIVKTEVSKKMFYC